MSLDRFDKQYFDQGCLFLAGADECGRGCLAGPVAAAAVILPKDCIIPGLNDSKKLSAKKRESLYPVILEQALAVGLSFVGPDIIDEINILQASLRAIGAAINNLQLRPEIVLIDGRFLPDIDIDAKLQALPGGDGISQSIAAASVVAKVTRDRLMVEYAKNYPNYGFDRHKGYATAAHYAALKEFGPCLLHRRSFRLN